MTDISDEVRKVADEYDVFPLYTLADRIDRELVELPKDADGVPIHVGDTVWTVKNGSVALKVTSITLYGDVVAVDGVCEGCHAHVVHSGLVLRVRPDSFERIADELDAWCNSVDVDGDACDKPRELSERIRKLAATDGERS